MDDLPADYDAIVVGTGMIESIIAAAISRVGKSVLHLDPNEYYGENWASFNLEGFENWVKNIEKNDTLNKIVHENLEDLIKENEIIINLNKNSNLWNAKYDDYFKKEKSLRESFENEERTTTIVGIAGSESDDKKESNEEPQEGLKKLGRRFNLDLCPKLLFSKGLLVQLLISSNIARYCEFKSVSRVLTWRENQLEPVPCSRADVFATKNVSVVQKRILVKILTLFANYTDNLEEFQGFEKKTFLEFLRFKKLPDNLIHYILYAIAMGDDRTSCLDGVKACKAFLESLGRYGNTPFIFPMYGSGELPQCFCRLCAVFGGIYCLQRGIEGLVVNDKKCVGVISNKKRLNAKTVILSSNYAPKEYLHNEENECISRGVYITDRSILKGDKESLTLLQFPPVPQVSKNSVTVIELGSGTCTCPDNYFIVHMTTKMTKNASSDFKHVVDSLFQNEDEMNKNDSKPKILRSGTWNVARGTSLTSDSCIQNLKVCCSVDSELDYDFSITEAKRIFNELYPDEEFLPRAPDPEEIVLDTDEKQDENISDVEKNIEKTKEITTKEESQKQIENIDLDENLMKPMEEHTTNLNKNSNNHNCDMNTPNNDNNHSPES